MNLSSYNFLLEEQSCPKAAGDSREGKKRLCQDLWFVYLTVLQQLPKCGKKWASMDHDWIISLVQFLIGIFCCCLRFHLFFTSNTFQWTAHSKGFPLFTFCCGPGALQHIGCCPEQKWSMDLHNLHAKQVKQLARDQYETVSTMNKAMVCSKAKIC